MRATLLDPLLPAALLGVLFGCAIEDIVLVERDALTLDADAAEAGNSGGPGCRQSDECDAEEYCEMPDCESVVGTCRPRETECGSEARPVCGCDGVTYFNDCLRQASRVSAKTDAECRLDARRCGTADDLQCPEGAHCARLAGIFSVACLSELPGSCWVLPAECDPLLDPNWAPCGGAALGACVDFCSAIRGGVPHARVLGCP